MGHNAYAHLFFGIPLSFEMEWEELIGDVDEKKFLSELFGTKDHGVEFILLGSGDYPVWAISAKGYEVQADWGETVPVLNRMFPGLDVHQRIVTLYQFLKTKHPDEDFKFTDQPQHYLGASLL